MRETPFPTAPDGLELQRWSEAGTRQEPSEECLVTIQSPDQQFRLTIAVEGPVSGFLIQLHVANSTEDEPISQMVVDDEALARRVAAEMAVNADHLAEVADQDVVPAAEPTEPDEKQVLETPDRWSDEDEDEDVWDEALDDA